MVDEAAGERDLCNRLACRGEKPGRAIDTELPHEFPDRHPVHAPEPPAEKHRVNAGDGRAFGRAESAEGVRTHVLLRSREPRGWRDIPRPRVVPRAHGDKRQGQPIDDGRRTCVGIAQLPEQSRHQVARVGAEQPRARSKLPVVYSHSR
jgi:hypothetical protein